MFVTMARRSLKRRAGGTGAEPIIGGAGRSSGLYWGCHLGLLTASHDVRPLLHSTDMRIPISCSLEQRDARSQLDQWQKVLDRVVDRSDRVSPNRLDLSIVPGSEIGPVISLAQRELTCCPFFTFTIEIAAERAVLVIVVPDDAVGVLDQFDASSG